LLGVPQEQPMPQLPEGLQGPWEMTPQEATEQRRKEGAAIGLTGDALQRYALTAQLPSRYGEPETIRRVSTAEEAREDALQAKADKLHKSVKELTAQERIDAIRENRAATTARISTGEEARQDALQAKADELSKPVEKLTAKERIDAIREAKAKAAGTDEAPLGYTAGGPSNANPNLNPGIEDDAFIGLTTGKWPPVGRAGTALANRQMRVRERAGEIRVEWGMTRDDIGALQTTTAENKKQFGRINQLDSFLNAADTTLNLNAQWARELSSRFNRGDIQLYNEVLGALKTGTGSDEALNLAGQLHTLAQTWAKILEGGVQSVSGVSVRSAEDAQALLYRAMSDHQLDSFITNVIFKDRDHRKVGVDQEKVRLLDSIRRPAEALGGGGGGGGGAQGGGREEKAAGQLPKPSKPGELATRDVMRQYGEFYGGDLKKAAEAMRAAGYK